MPKFSTKYPDERHPAYSVSVAYQVTAPAGTRVTVNTVSGRVNVTAIKGAQAMPSVAGDVNITAGGQVAKIHSVSGDVVLRISSPRTASRSALSRAN